PASSPAFSGGPAAGSRPRASYRARSRVGAHAMAPPHPPGTGDPPPPLRDLTPRRWDPTRTLGVDRPAGPEIQPRPDGAWCDWWCSAARDQRGDDPERPGRLGSDHRHAEARHRVAQRADLLAQLDPQVAHLAAELSPLFVDLGAQLPDVGIHAL